MIESRGRVFVSPATYLVGLGIRSRLGDNLTEVLRRFSQSIQGTVANINLN
jgi:hypothetical protein